MTGVVTAGAGFLLAVLWFDLMFDVQVRGHDGEVLPEPVLASIAGYYARVTTAASPMNRFVAFGMVVTLAGLVGEAATGHPGLVWVVTSVALAVPPIALAAARVVPNAVRLGTREDDGATQSAIAREIHRDHWYCFASILGLLVVQGLSALA